MRNETATAPIRITQPQEYAFSLVQTEAEITQAIEKLAATGHTPFALVRISLAYKNMGTKERRAERTEKTSLYLLQHIRPMTRRTDLVFFCHHTLYFVLLGANLQGAHIVEERLWEALLWCMHNMGTQEIVSPSRVTIGHAAFPDPHTTPDELLRASNQLSRHVADQVPQSRQHTDPKHPSRQETAPVEQPAEVLLLAKKLGIPYLAPLPQKLPQRVLHSVNAHLARELRCYPIGRERNTLTVAMLNPQDHQALERLHQETGLLIFPVLTHAEALDTAIQQLP